MQLILSNTKSGISIAWSVSDCRLITQISSLRICTLCFKKCH